MIKLIVAIKRNPAMSPAEFHEYWRTTHSEKVRALTSTLFFVTSEDVVLPA